ncbi:MAG: hypothetical protein MHM6MM_003474 [Cercozoa sp. M6MM]
MTTPESKSDEMLQQLVGKPALREDDAVPEGGIEGVDYVVVANEHAKGHRVLPPNSMMTMDYRPDRINYATDENFIITRVFKG